MRLKHKLKNSWYLSEELELRKSRYQSSQGVLREDSRLRLRMVVNKKINKQWTSGLRYSYTDNDSNISIENYTRSNIQIFADWNF